MSSERESEIKMCRICEHYDGGKYVTNECIDCINECNFEHAGNNAKMALLTREWDEWQQRAEAAEKALQEMQARVEQIEVVRTFDSGMSDDFRKFLKRWIRDDIGEMIDGKNLIQITERPIDTLDSVMRGTVLILRPVKGENEQ